MALSLVELFLLNFPLMKASAAKGKITQLDRARLAHRASGLTTSYPKTRIRASRLYEAAFTLAFIELTRRLHQAYQHAYDKQAVDKVLPQNTERRLTRDEYLTLRNEMAKALQSQKCRDFIDTLISYNQGGMHYDSEKDFLAYSDATFNSAEGGVFFKNAAGGIFRQHAGDYPKVFIGPGWRLDLNAQRDASTLMHELIHGLTRGADNQLSDDIQKLGIVPIGRNGKPLPPPTGSRNGEYYNDYSGYWDTALRNACFPKS